jgi:CheY-like chemotaxis protein
MPSGGRLEISACNVTVGPDGSRVPAGRYVELIVKDTGSGMSADVMNHLFEPFFTTKPAGIGTGLGLATVYGIIMQNGGGISVHSEMGKGTTVRMLLPAVEPVEAPSLPRGGPAGDEPHGAETLLFVEDNDMVRRLTHMQLERLGYVVHSFAGGPEALSWASAWTGSIDLLVTDVVMPEMNGRALARHLRAARPGVRILYVSGYTDEVVGQSETIEDGAVFLGKPFTRRSLALAVREALAPR